MASMRLALVTTLLFLTSSALAGEKEGQCQLDCLPALQACMQPCAPGGVADLDDPKKKDAFTACARKCGDKVKPCMDACNPPVKPGAPKKQ